MLNPLEPKIVVTACVKCVPEAVRKFVVDRCILRWIAIILFSFMIVIEFVVLSLLSFGCVIMLCIFGMLLGPSMILADGLAFHKDRDDIMLQYKKALAEKEGATELQEIGTTRKESKKVLLFDGNVSNIIDADLQDDLEFDRATVQYSFQGCTYQVKENVPTKEDVCFESVGNAVPMVLLSGSPRSGRLRREVDKYKFTNSVCASFFWAIIIHVSNVVLLVVFLRPAYSQLWILLPIAVGISVWTALTTALQIRTTRESAKRDFLNHCDVVIDDTKVATTGNDEEASKKQAVHNY